VDLSPLQKSRTQLLSDLVSVQPERPEASRLLARLVGAPLNDGHP
jgi:hypothetical protein